MRRDLDIDTDPTSSSVGESSPRLKTTNRDDDDDDVVEEEEDITALLVVRIAGGWVRDKLLGRSNDDVDIATNVVTGVQFAQLLQSYLQEHPQEQPKTVAATKMGIIASNPEQSKHLETACMRICQIDMDITNFRGQEQYQDPNSRIPLLVQCGTPTEDAYRRDFTINSLFYNLQTNCIEDYTARGIQDLQNRRLITPFPPSITFYDDPLRLLRAIRFTIRFRLTMDPTIVAAAQDSHIQTALRQKVSRERVGKELEGMLSGKNANAIAALELVYRLHLSSCIFTVPMIGVHCTSVYGSMVGIPYPILDADTTSNSSVQPMELLRQQQLHQMGWDASRHLLSVLPQVLESHNDSVRENESTPTLQQQLSSNRRNRINQRLLVLALYLSPFRALLYTEIPKSNHVRTGAPLKEYNVVFFMMKDAIKFKNIDAQGIMTLMTGVSIGWYN
jgi:tRNA nucleotidyltransferase/poly(A) polymerase